MQTGVPARLEERKLSNFQTFEYIQTFEYTATSLRDEGLL